MEAVAEEIGFALCDSSASRAVAYRRLGSIPFTQALGACDIGEAKLADGRRVLITWGRLADRQEQFWFAHNSTFTPVWCGDEGGACELIIGDTFGSSDSEDWLWLGMRIARDEGPEWREVG
jgi:hypothetical protein